MTRWRSGVLSFAHLSFLLLYSNELKFSTYTTVLFTLLYSSLYPFYSLYSLYPQFTDAIQFEDYDSEPPLLEELGIRFDHIMNKTQAVMYPNKVIYTYAHILVYTYTRIYVYTYSQFDS